MSTYYEYQDVGVMIAHKLMKMDGWKVYGYHADESDSMIDYYSPAYWNGVAEKNGYIFCFNVYGAAAPYEVKQYNYNSFSYSNDVFEKIEKLKKMTVENGASEQEEESAKKSIIKLQEKAATDDNNKNNYIVKEVIPGHMAHPSRMNWHIEKNGVIIDKGNGMLKFAAIDNYYRYDRYMDELNKYKNLTKEEFITDYISDYSNYRYESDEESARRSAEYSYEKLAKDSILVDKFEKFITKIDTTCGALIGEGDNVVYEKVTITEYKKENKIVEDTTGEVKDGQCFVLKTNFNYGMNKGYVYKIVATEYNGDTIYYAYKLNGKLTKTLTGYGNSANRFGMVKQGDTKFNTWIEKGCIAWCHIEEVNTPYQVEKVVKKVIKNNNKNDNDNKAAGNKPAENINVNNYNYTITEDVDTRSGEKIYLVKVDEKLSKEDYIQVNKYIKSLGGYYSKFKHAFLFKEYPSILNACISESNSNNNYNNINGVPESTDNTDSATQGDISQNKPVVKYDIQEDTHTKTGAKIWVVRIQNSINKLDFMQVKHKLAELNGFYSNFKHGFIFNYNPSDVLNVS